MDRNNLSLSIIVPVYNVEKYLEKCLVSIFNQDIPLVDYEVIVVNDGSTDNSSKIISRFEQLYFNLRIINQENKGLSGARNSGLKIAKGKYVWFIDSDDWIKKNCLKELINRMNNDNIDLLLINLLHIDEEENVLARPNLPVYSMPVDGITLSKHLELGWNVCRYIIDRQLLEENNLYFRTNILFEDGIFMDKLFFYVKKVAIEYDYIYFYLKRKGSIAEDKSKIEKRQDSFFILAKEGIEFMNSIENNSYKKTLKKKIISYICQFLNYQSITHNRDYKRKIKEILPVSYKDENIAYKLRIFAINNFPSFYGWIMKNRDKLMNRR